LTISIRNFTDADEAAVVEILSEMQSAELPFNPRMKPVAAIGPWYVSMLKAQEDTAFLVAESGGKCAGFAVVLLNVIEAGDMELQPNISAHVTELGVAQTARGQGLATALLQECERRARRAGCDELTLSVYCGNEPAQKLYHKAGFADFKVRMRKSLE